MSEAPKEERKPYTRMTEAQRVEAIALYRAGVATAEEAAKKVGVDVEALRSLFKRKKIKKGDQAKELEDKKVAIVQQALALDPAVHARRVFDTKNETYRYIEMIRKLTVKTIVECQQKNLPLGTIQNDIKALREAAATVKTCREEAFAVLGVRLDDAASEELPELTIKGLDDDQIQDLRAAPLIEAPEIPDIEIDEGE